MDLTENNVAAWGFGGEHDPETTLSSDTGVFKFGSHSIRATTAAAFDWFLVYPVNRSADWDLTTFERLQFWIRGHNTNEPTWQGRFPIVVLEDSDGRRISYEPETNLLGLDTWAHISMPLSGGEGWTSSGFADLSKIRAFEIHADTWGEGFTIWLDAVEFRVDVQTCFDCTEACGDVSYCAHDHGVPKCTCVPNSCESLGQNCGVLENGCGGMLDCGGCEFGTCVSGECVCEPLTCVMAQVECGTITDGCGNDLACGSCSDGTTCQQGVCIAADDACMDLAENNLELWGYGGEQNPVTVLAKDPSRRVAGKHSIVAYTTAAFDWFLAYPLARNANWDLSKFESLEFSIRGHNTNEPTWQGRFPVIVLEDILGNRLSYEPEANLLGLDTWNDIVVPLHHGAGWTKTGNADLSAIRALEIHVDTWGQGFAVWIDALQFKTAGGACFDCVSMCGLGVESCAFEYGVPECSCALNTCDSLGFACGAVSDGCGGTLDCGSCASGACVSGQCVCDPISCAEQQVECGLVADGCGGILDCGSCANGTCQQGQCVCHAETCESLGRQCGYAVDGCGGMLHCGNCAFGECKSGECVCDALTCDSLDMECGTVPDGCGQELFCGKCMPGFDCQSGVCTQVEKVCMDLAEDNIDVWGAAGEGNPSTELALDSFNVVAGGTSLKAHTTAAFDWHLAYPKERNAEWDLSMFETLQFWIRGHNANEPTWQGNFPVVVLEDNQGGRVRYEPTSNLLGLDAWNHIQIPLEGGPGWKQSGEADLTDIRVLEIHADTWGEGFVLWVDAVEFLVNDIACFDCEQDCNLATQACGELNGIPQCINTSGGTDPEGEEKQGLVWPNEFSRANSDPWISKHHAEIGVLKPRVLAINFANDVTTPDLSATTNRIVAAFEDGSRPKGYAHPDNLPTAQLQYQVAELVNLKDPGADSQTNSRRFPRSPQSKGWPYMNYAAFFDGTLSDVIGDVCERLDTGDIHEIWFFAHQLGSVYEIPAESLEAKQQYDAANNPIPGAMNRCAGNGCFRYSDPVCSRSIRITFFNVMDRCPDNFMHSIGHAMESAGRRLPFWAKWFKRYAGLDLNTRYPEFPYADLYVTEGAIPQLVYTPQTPGVDSRLTVKINDSYLRTINHYQPVCGNVHFPPNAAHHYDTSNRAPVPSLCDAFGTMNSTQPSMVAADRWQDHIKTDVCGDEGRYGVWWRQNMPAYGSGHKYKDGTPMPSVWPFLFY